MHIRRFIVAESPVIADLDLLFWNDSTDLPLDKVLLTGTNGSGKTSMMRLIVALWQNVPSWLWLEDRLPTNHNVEQELLHATGLVAVELIGLAKEPVVIFYARNEEFASRLDDAPSVLGQIGPEGATPQPAGIWATLQGRLQYALVGGDLQMPNLVYMEPDALLILRLHEHERRRIQPEPLYQWLTIFQPTGDADTHIETQFRNLKIRDPKWFYDTIQFINQFLDGKQLTDFDDKLRLLVVGKDGSKYRVDGLSHGESRMLIYGLTIQRWLMRGGIVLLDEPDTHLHVSAQRQFVNALLKLVAARDAQIFIASHSPTVWDEFDLVNESVDLIPQFELK